MARASELKVRISWIDSGVGCGTRAIALSRLPSMMCFKELNLRSTFGMGYCL